MGTHNVFDNNQCPCGPINDPIVDKLLGNAYQVVKYVAMNMPAIKVVSDEIASILAVYAKLKELSDIQAKIPELMEVQAALPHLEVLHTNLVQLLTLYTHIDELVKVATGIDDTLIITPHLQELASVAANITEVVATGTNITKVIAVANSIASVNKLAPVVAEIDALAQNVQALVNINTHLPELLNINHHLPDLLNIETPLSKLVINSFEALRRTYAEAGLTLVTGSFEDGAKVTTKQDVVLERKTGKAYSWLGNIPDGGKIIPAGSTPENSGGVGADGWSSQGNAQLRTELSSTSGSALVSFQQLGNNTKLRSVQSKLRDTISISDYGGIADGVFDNSVVALKMQSDVGFIRFTRGGYLFKDVELDCPLIFDFGAYLVADNNSTIRITDIIESPRQWIFRGNGGYSLGHDSDSGENTRQVHIAWFGATPSPYYHGMPDQAPFFQKAFLALGNGRESVVQCDVGNYMMRSPTTPTRACWLKGEGTRRTVFLHDTDGFDTFTTAENGVKFTDIQFEVQEGVLPTRNSKFINIQHPLCEIYDVDVSNSNGCIAVGADNCRIKNIRGAFGHAGTAGSYVINITGGARCNIDGVQLGTSSVGPEHLVLIGGANQTNGISGANVRNISQVAPCKSVSVEATAGSIRNTIVDGVTYDGVTTAKPPYICAVKATGANSVADLIIDNLVVGSNAENVILFEQDGTGTISRAVVNNVQDSGTTGRGISFVEKAGTLMDIAISSNVKVAGRAEPFYFEGRVDGVVIEPGALPNTFPVYSYDFTVADDSVVAIKLNKPVYTGMLFASRGGVDYLQLAIRAAASPVATRISGNSAFAEVTTVLAGNTGVDGKATIGVVDGFIYLENRIGSQQRFNITLLSA